MPKLIKEKCTSNFEDLGGVGRRNKERIQNLINGKI